MTNKELIDIYGIEEVLLPVSEAVKSASNQIAPSEKKSAPAAKSPIATWEALRVALTDCKACALAKQRKNIVFGEGDENAELMFIGEGPGEDEDKTGRPFIGKAGQLLTKMIEAIGLTREQVYIANVVKCRPPANREPFAEEVEACIDFLKTQIGLIKPKVIVCLGATSAGHLLNPGKRISSIRGRFMDYQGIRVMPTYHPAYLLRNESKKRDVWNDLKAVMAELGLKK
jgi:DNA polymerase